MTEVPTVVEHLVFENDAAQSLRVERNGRRHLKDVSLPWSESNKPMNNCSLSIIDFLKQLLFSR